MTGLPFHLNQNQAQGVQIDEPVAQFEIGAQRNFIYLILDWQTRKAAVVDPQTDLEPWLSALAQHGFELERVLLTHSHWDHVGGLPQLIRQMPRVPIHVHSLDRRRLKGEEYAHGSWVETEDLARISVGRLDLQALHTPGHSAGELTYWLQSPASYVFTGDTVFIRDCGRTDFPDGSNEEMFESLQRIKVLPPETILLPGHHYAPECATTIGRELDSSPPLRCQSVAELAALP